MNDPPFWNDRDVTTPSVEPSGGLPDHDEPGEASDLDMEDGMTTADADWDVFLSEEGDEDPQPEPGDFWDEVNDGDEFEASWAL